MSNISYRKIAPDELHYFADATKIVRDSQGDLAVGDNQLASMAKAPDCYVLGAFNGDELIGVATAGILPKAFFKYYENFHPDLDKKLHYTKIVLIHHVAVIEKFQGMGVGREFLRLRQQWARENGAEYVLTCSWENKKKFSSPRLFFKDGFQMMSHYCNFKPEDADKKICLICDSGCRCEHYLFFKKI